MAEYVIWQPQPKQAVALACPAFELLYGGAAGGGKSDFLLADFLSGASDWKQNWRGILFRKTYTELGELLRRARELYIPLGAAYHAGERRFAFPGGAELELRYLETETDVERYQGHQYTWAGFDELGNYKTDYCWRYMTSRLRSAAGAPCYIRGTANPGGPGHGWIKARFIDGKLPSVIYRLDGSTRVFIPATVEDNKILMDNDPGYVKRLEALPEHIYRALRLGDWDVFAGQVFGEFRREKHVVKPFALPPEAWYKFYSFDWGYKKPFSLGKWAVNGDGRVIRYGEWYGCKEGEANAGLELSAGEAARRAWAMAVQEGVTDIVCDPAIWGKDDDAPSVAERLEQAGFIAIRGKHDRMAGLARLHDMLTQPAEDGRPMLLIFDTCHAFIRTIPLLVPHPNHPEDVDTNLEDHVYDETRYALMSESANFPRQEFRRQAAAWLPRKGAGWDPFQKKSAWNPLDY
ncbi:MAG: terminase family protein [Treponema sp.]|jgi:hypothetical protein|nr:terminase family protein [Treponema sp.]